MQKNIFWILLIGIMAASCGSGKKDEAGSLNDKKAKLAKLKADQKKLNDQITLLQDQIAKEDTSASKDANKKLVTIRPIATSAFNHFLELQGTVTAQNISYVAPPNGVGGVVKALYVTQGQQVHKGQLLAKLDDQVIRQQMEPLRVQLGSAEDTYRRTKNLFDQGIGTYQNVLNAKTQVESLQKQIGVIQNQASLMNVSAPSTGVADMVNIRVGEILSPQQNAQAPQIRIVNTGNLKVTTQVPENYISRISMGTPVEIVLPDENNRTINAKVTVIGKIIDPNTRTFYVEATIPSNANLKPNQIAKVRIKDYGTNNAITIPVNTLQNDEKGKYVMVAAKEGDKLVAHKRTVTVGELYNNELEVKSGLAAGDQIITEGFQGLYEGQELTTSVK